ncbi:hypothetical protein E4U61_003106 [Claviceps capensis]|nr:hypothetical protein E4U61_003106 [Claviceps capensis]
MLGAYLQPVVIFTSNGTARNPAQDSSEILSQDRNQHHTDREPKSAREINASSSSQQQQQQQQQQ